jgi:hypothetical protein
MLLLITGPQSLKKNIRKLSELLSFGITLKRMRDITSLILSLSVKTIRLSDMLAFNYILHIDNSMSVWIPQIISD